MSNNPDEALQNTRFTSDDSKPISIRKEFKVWDGSQPYHVIADDYRIDERGYLMFYVGNDVIASFNHDKWIEVKLILPNPQDIESLIRNSLTDEIRRSRLYVEGTFREAPKV